jgi:hypothetical protein
MAPRLANGLLPRDQSSIGVTQCSAYYTKVVWQDRSDGCDTWEERVKIEQSAELLDVIRFQLPTLHPITGRW